MRISDWSSDVCSSDLLAAALGGLGHLVAGLALGADEEHAAAAGDDVAHGQQRLVQQRQGLLEVDDVDAVADPENERGHARIPARSEEQTTELQSLMRT